MKKQHKEGTCKVLGRSVVFSAFYADFCLCPKLMIITTLIFCDFIQVYIFTTNHHLNQYQLGVQESAQEKGCNRSNA